MVGSRKSTIERFFVSNGELAGQLFAKEWDEFVLREQLTPRQAEQFHHYMRELKIQSSMINLTTITTPKNIIAFHFCDSLELRRCIDMSTVQSLCDVGAGGGFPGIPLKIMFPHLRLILIEVNKKKIHFLETMIKDLGLENCEIYPLDWRTFLRKTQYDIDLFCTRASLQLDELIRMFKPSSPYKTKKLVYWASSLWQAEQKVQPFVERECPYSSNNRSLKLVFFGLSDKQPAAEGKP
jgi:16S rRNA (guanine(527)-N(7))-methyltransferase RsmG